MTGAKWMPKVEWDGWRINLGHVLTIVTIIGGLLVGWNDMQSERAVQRAVNARYEKDLALLTARADVLAAKMTDSERETVRVMTRVETTLSGLQNAIARLERLAEREDNRGIRP